MRIKKTQVHGNKVVVTDTPKTSVSDTKSKATTQTAVKKSIVKEATSTKVTPKSPTRAAKNVESEKVTQDTNKSDLNIENASQKQEKSKISEQSKVGKESKSTASSKNDEKGNTSAVNDKNKKKIKSTALIKKSIDGSTNKKTASSSLLKRKINIMKKKVVGNKKSLSEKNPKKISNELRNLGIDILLDGPKGFGLKQTTDAEDCKTSICESVKTKSRSTVSASTNYVPFMKVNKIKSGQSKNDSSKASVTGDENNEKKESDVSSIKEESSSSNATTGKGDTNKKKSDSVNNKQDDDNNKKVKGNEALTTVSFKEGTQKKNDEQIDSLIKKGTTNVKKVNAKKNNSKGNVKESYDKLSNNEEKVTEDDKDEKRDDENRTDEKSVDVKEKLSKVRRKYVKKPLVQKSNQNKKELDTQSKIEEKNDEKTFTEPPVSRPNSTTASIGSMSSKDIYESSVTSPVRPIIRREPIFKHKAKLKAEAAQRQQMLQSTSSSPISITVAKTDSASISSDDKKEVELIVLSSPKKSIDSTGSDDKKGESDPLGIKTEKSMEKDDVTKKVPTQKKIKTKSKDISTASITNKNNDDDKVKKSSKKPVVKAKLVKRATTIKKGKVLKSSSKLKSKQNSDDTDESEEDENDSESSESSVITRIQKRRAAKTRHMKKYGFWSGPKRHREASLNALAKVHCLYENESRSALEQNLIKAAKLESLKELQKTRAEMKKKEEIKNQSNDEEEDESKSSKNDNSSDESDVEEPEEENKRTLRTAAGVRGVGKFWENDESNLSSDQESIAQKKSKLKKVKVKDEKDNGATGSQSNKKKLPPKSLKVNKHPPIKKKILSKVKSTVPLKKRPINLPKSNSKSSDSDNSDTSESDSDDDPKSTKKNNDKAQKRKRNNSTSSMDFKNVLTKKRMASLNATAMLAATYEVERAIDKQLSEQTPKQEKTEKSESKKIEKDEKQTGQEKVGKGKDATEKPQKGEKDNKTSIKKGKEKDKNLEKEKKKSSKGKDDEKELKNKVKKEPKDLKRIKQEKRDSPTKIKNLKHEADEPIRPVSTSVVIVQDTDVTITGVYVNSTQGTNQEAYCKMQYRVQSSVTEERVVRPATNEPPKSYTPLNAIASMRPPVEQMNPIHYGQPPMCESPYMDRNNYPPPPPPSAVPTSSSAFCSPMPPHHDLNSAGGYNLYQPAGPLISHLSQPQVTKTIPPTIDSDGRPQQQPQSSGSAAGDSDNDVLITGADRPPQPYRYGPQGPGLYSRPVHQMHCPTYAPNYYPPYPQHPQEMCYPYQGPYYPPKPYPPSPFPGRYAYSYGPPPGPSEMYDRPPPQNPQPPTGQIVAAGPSVPQHMDHYPGPQPYYPNYNPPGSQCYTRGIQPPYMDASHYQNTCPCPMQSCPKNVHTGPLIGSKASKGPVKTEPLIATTNTTSSTSSSCAPSNSSKAHTTQSTTTPIITCKTEELSPLPKHIIIKPEHCVQQGSNSGANGDNNVECPEQIVHAPLPINPNYVMNSELGCPEISVSPARGSIGLPQAVPLTRAEIAQGNNDPIVPIQRRPRIGKSMERERLNFPNGCPLTDAGGTITQLDKTSDMISNIKTEIKEENSIKVKQEEIEEILSSEEEKMEIESVSSTMTYPNPSDKCCNVNTPRKLTPFTIEALVSSDSNQGTKASSICSTSTHTSKRKDLHDDDSDNSVIRIEDNSSPDIPVKRRKLLSDTNVLAPKKSPPNSYKCLIKQATFKNYLAEARQGEATNTSNSTNISTTSSTNDPIVIEKTRKKSSLKRSRRRKAFRAKKVVLKIKQRMIAIPKQLRRKRKYSLKKLKRLTPKQECVEIVDMTTEDDQSHQEIKEEPVPIDISSPSVEEVHEEEYHHDLTEQTSEKEDSIVSIKEEHCETDIKTEATHEEPKLSVSEEKIESVHVIEPDTETCSTLLAETGTSTPTSQMTNIDLTIDMVARGYFSEPEILNSFSKHRIKKLKQQEGRSKSETNREKQDKLNEILKAKSKELKAKKREAKRAEKELKRASKKAEKQVIEEVKEVENIEVAPIIEEAAEENHETADVCTNVVEEKPKTKKGRKPKDNTKGIDKMKISKVKKMKKSVDEEKPVDTTSIVTINNNIIHNATSIIDDELPLEELVKIKKRKVTKQHEQIAVVSRKPKQVKKKSPSSKQNPKNATETIVPVMPPLNNTDASNAKDDLITPLTAPHSNITQEDSTMNGSDLVETDTVNNNKLILYNNEYNKKPAQKRGKNRIKFGNRKRHRTSHANKEVQEVLIPRSVHSKPRWCNGWSWHGKPFQAKVFLNSDDPPVLRTCYPAMVHQTGDIIRPKDCVLLRAGNKRTELPYVAKIAYLWENPEDGEMMTSLLWYYRPEHTEQGRQPIDSPEEVFASRHKDHNSVACIEDKCYVLTFNEYCRYRRQLRAIEDGVYEQISIVPKLNRENPRCPPPNTLPDLVMFCRRIYEFRLKRLLKQPN